MPTGIVVDSTGKVCGSCGGGNGIEKKMATMPRVPSWTDIPKMDKTRAFYESVGGPYAYTPGWKCADNEISLHNKHVTGISEALAMKTRQGRGYPGLVEQPVRPNVDTNPELFPTVTMLRKAKEDRLAEPVLSAAICPVKYPSPEADLWKYPKITKKGGDNPLYYTTATLIGLEPPRQHQLAERYFPKNNDFAKSFTDTKKFYFPGAPSYCLNTTKTRSRAHMELDQPY